MRRGRSRTDLRRGGDPRAHREWPTTCSICPISCVDGELRVTRMKELYSEGYYSVDGYPLRDGMRAAIGGGE
jgi:hypothetical protein